MSFESTFAAFGRALDGVVIGVRDRLPRGGNSYGRVSIRERIGERVNSAIDRSKAAMAGGSERFGDQRTRARLGIGLLVITSIAITAAVTRYLTDTPSPADSGGSNALLHALAEARDAHRTNTGTPQPIRASGPKR